MMMMVIMISTVIRMMVSDEDEDDERGSPVSSSSLSASTLVSGLPEQVGSEQKIINIIFILFLRYSLVI